MSVLFYPESIRILGSDANGNNIILCEMAVDDIANLPAANAFISDGYVLSMGCKAIVINDNSIHRLNSLGQWVQIAAGTSTYTRAEIDAIQADLQNQIDYAINTGSKNLLHFDQIGYSANQGTTRTHRGVTFTLTDYTIICSGTNDNTSASHCRLFLGANTVYVSNFCDGMHILSGAPIGGVGKWSMSAYYGVGSTTLYNKVDYGGGVLLTSPEESGYDILIDITIAKGQNADGIVFKPMIRQSSIIDDTFELYAPTNRQLYEMILQLQGG